jgi:hypothetical protein
MLSSASEAAVLIMEKWPEEHGSRFQDALQACREEQEDFLVRFLARETGITEAQARDLIDMVGTGRSSLLREARILKAQHWPALAKPSTTETRARLQAQRAQAASWDP